MTGGIHIAQFQFLHDVYLTVNKKKYFTVNKKNELVHNLKPTRFAITVTAWQAKFQNLPYAMHFKFNVVVTHS